MSLNDSAALFACNKCFTRHPFSELSTSEQLCKKCRTNYPMANCSYCRAEFPEKPGSSTTTCKKCSLNVKTYGQPTACEYCKMMAAFIGKKCQRCANYARKCGLPRNCQQCQQQCAFTHVDDRKNKVSGKLLCWLCTMAYKRAGDRAPHPAGHVRQEGRSENKHESRRNREPDWVKSTSESDREDRKQEEYKSLARHGSDSDSSSSAKKLRLDKSANGLTRVDSYLELSQSSSARLVSDLLSTDGNIVALTQLKEKVEALKKQVAIKDSHLLEKDRKITELKAEFFEKEKVLLTKLSKSQKEGQESIEQLMIKNRDYARQIASLSKLGKKHHKGSSSTDYKESPKS